MPADPVAPATPGVSHPVARRGSGKSGGWVTAWVLGAALSARAATWTVDHTQDGLDAAPGNGLCADAQGRCTVRAAMLEANAWPGADRIELPPGTYVLERAGSFEELGLVGDLDVLDALTLVGAGSAETVLDAGGLDGVLDLRASGAGSVTVQGIRLTGGRVNDNPLPGQTRGVGLNIAAGVQAVLDDVIVDDQRAMPGAGQVVLGVRNLGCLRATRLRVLDTVADPDAAGARVAGLYHSGAEGCLELDTFEIAGNRGINVGGVMIDVDAQATLRSGLITGNHGGVAALHVNLGNTVLLENVSIVDNRAGPALLNDGFSTVTLRHCTVTGNRARDGLTVVVGGIDDVHGVPLVHVSNSIVYGNGPGFLANDCRAVMLTGGGSMLGDSLRCRVFGATLGDLLDVDPALGPLTHAGGYTRTVAPGAPAIDTASPDHCSALDQRGVARPQDGNGDGTARCDRGAMEWVPPAVYADGFEAAGS